MSTPAFIAESVTFDVIRKMARQQVFIAQDNDPVRPVRETSVIIRDTTDDREVDAGNGERNIEKPGIIITYMGASYPTQAGQNCHDDGSHNLLIQLVDDAAPRNTQRKKSYYFWLNSIRKKLQANPYRENVEPCIGDFWTVHVRQIGAADRRDLHLHRLFRAGLQVTCFVRESRT